MDAVGFAKYPFTQEALSYVRDRNYSMEDILQKPAYGQVRLRAKKRVLNSIKGDVQADDLLPDPERELLSYPVARMLVAMTEDQYLMKRFALWESKRAYTLLLDESDTGLMDVGRDFGITARAKDREFIIHFTDYLRYAAGLRNLEWKLINRKVVAGMVYVSRETFTRLLEEAVREKIQAGFGAKVPAEMKPVLEPYLAEIRESLDKLKSEKGLSGDGEVTQDSFPPCMKNLLADLQKGINLPHTARFALTSFLANIGLDKDAIMDLYRMAPDFREDLTHYQVQHITGGSGTEYTCPGCKTMMTYGNCIGKNKLCEYVTHPLSYYRKSQRRRAKEMAAAQAFKGSKDKAVDTVAENVHVETGNSPGN
ncbi:DNA primase regulatory subunit PriL [Methanocella arvoryzae]|uniref:DNA primase large subunit PriL n=1 Tax=Methanocella arvoryzae (strain DSM 22066 / NBRC 105507 / MRE50) TaxID=351160 RepID=PRIL_METAR|nr:DNA primase regulatory subunit PriL [Methanocella arvoryzae]Q0W2J3.1 RecName: Full=DNA primase large subunit PriL [Methanocella arvoryzae MRE50]CAJ37400.1 DNA primase, large subunit [Methanocella arvoryzae MRE50]